MLMPYLKKFLLLLLIVFVADRAIGHLLEYLFYQQKRGDDYISMYVVQKSNEQVLIFGSSRASHHYVPNMFEEILYKTCFNAGRDKMDILYFNAMINITLQRYTPEIIVLDILPYSLSRSVDMASQIDILNQIIRPLFKKYPSLESMISLSGAIELWKMKLSKIYIYNSKVFSILQNTYTNFGRANVKGYKPVYGQIDPAIYRKPIWNNIEHDTSLNKVYVDALQNIIAYCKEKNIQLTLVLSPNYFPLQMNTIRSYRAIHDIAQQNNTTLLDFSSDPAFLKRPELFYDDVHLNDEGAKYFTAKVIEKLRQ